MRVITLVIFSSLATSCSVIYSGVVKNNYSSQVSIGSSNGVRGNANIEPGSTTEVPIFETMRGTCISVSHNSNRKFYHVPAPPKWAKISGNWDVKFSLSVSPKGAYYVGRNGNTQELNEVPNCDI